MRSGASKNKMLNQQNRKWINRAVTVFLFCLAVAPAYARQIGVTGDDACDEATGTYIVTWYATNTETEPNRTMKITGVNRAVNGFGPGTVVAPNQTVTATETISDGFVGDVQIEVSAVWEYADPDITDSETHTVNISGHCYDTATVTSTPVSGTPGQVPPPTGTPTTSGQQPSPTRTPATSGTPGQVPPPTGTPTPVGSVPTATKLPATVIATITSGGPTIMPPTGTPPSATPQGGISSPTASVPTDTAPTDVPPDTSDMTATPNGGSVASPTPDGTPGDGTGSGISLIVEGLCGTPPIFTITNTGAPMTQPHAYYILSGLNQTVLAAGGFQLDAGESAIVTLSEVIDASDRVIFVTSDFGVTAEASLICEELASNTPDSFTGVTAVNSGIHSPSCDRACPIFKVYHTDETGGWEIFRLDSADETTRTSERTNLSLGLDPLFKSTAPSLSPDNQWVVFSSDRDGNWELYVAPTSGGDPDAVERVTFNTVAIDADPVWGPNNFVVYETTRHGTWDLYAIDMQTGMNYRLTDNGGNDINAYWSADGSTLVFQSDRPDADGLRRWQIYELSLATLQITKLSDGTSIDVDPQYSNHGDRIAFRSYAAEGGDSVIEIMNTDGTNRIMLSDAEGDSTNAVWSPNDTYIAYQSDLDGDLDLYVYEVATGLTRHLTDNSVADYAPTWLCDETRIVWTSDVMGDPNIFEVELVPATTEPILVDPDADQMTFEASNDVYPMAYPPEENASREGKTLLGDFGTQTTYLDPDVELTALDRSIDGAIRTEWQAIDVCTTETLAGGG
jgi:Tol biopolymer transport system component